MKMRRKVCKMKSKAQSIITILITMGIFLALLPAINNGFNFNANNNDVTKLDKETLKISAVSGKIHVDNNWTATESSYSWCTGSGTWNDPYVIEDLEIDGGGSGSCILIENSNVYFRIENCTIYNSGGYPDAGISLSNVFNGELINNTSSFNQAHGIAVKTCENITIRNNTINNNNAGIYVMDPTPIGPSVNINILENEIHNNTAYGIFLLRIDNSYVSKNNVSSGTFGIVSISSNDVYVGNNLVEDCDYAAIFVSDRDNNVNLTENLMTACGISIGTTYPSSGSFSKFSTYSIDTSNKVNGKPVYYYFDRNNLDIADYLNPGQIILVNCNNSNISEINISHSSYALTLLYCNNVSIIDCNFSDNVGGISLYKSNNNAISRNVIDSNNYAGIILSGCNNTLIYWNNISNNYDDLSPSLPYQEGQPSPSRNELGIGLMMDSNNNTLYGNTINNNKIGISLTKGANNTVKKNYITENYEYGIFLEDYSRNNLPNLATLNLIYWNTFNSNGINAQDDGTANMWDNGTIGNYWDDYSGKDANDDGIGDTPYTVPGSAGSQDNFPIWDDGPELGIPGYNLFFLFGALLVAAITLSMKLKKFNK